MNIVDFFWIWGPTGIWFLGTSIFFSAVVSLVNTQRTVHSLKKTTSELSTELERITSELRTDTRHLENSIGSLRQGTGDLNAELSKTRQVIDGFHKTLRNMCWWCE